jgi:hypothetical protein
VTAVARSGLSAPTFERWCSECPLPETEPLGQSAAPLAEPLPDALPDATPEADDAAAQLRLRTDAPSSSPEHDARTRPHAATAATIMNGDLAMVSSLVM